MKQFEKAALAMVIGVFASTCSAAEADALAISARIQARHLPYGTIIDPIYASSTSSDITAYTRCADSAIWTGHYLAAESFRYKATGDPAALANATSALAGLKSLVDVTGTDLLARCLVPMSSPYAAGITNEESANGIYTSGQNYWIGNTSRDEYLGVFFGLSVAYDMLGQAGIQASIQTLAARMLNFLIGHAWTVVMPDGTVSTTFIIRPDEQLGVLQVGRQVNPSQFASAYQNTVSTLASLVAAPVAVDAADVRDSYFKFNLDAINLYSLIRLEGNAGLKASYQAAYNIYHSAVQSHMNAHFNMVDRALNGPDANRDSDTVTYLNEWLERPLRDPYVDLEGQFASCVSADQSCDPIPVNLRIPTDFLWQRSPFQLVGGGSDLIESAGIDYILPYWMARYYGVIREGPGEQPVHRGPNLPRSPRER